MGEVIDLRAVRRSRALNRTTDEPDYFDPEFWRELETWPRAVRNKLARWVNLDAEADEGLLLQMAQARIPGERRIFLIERLATHLVWIRGAAAELRRGRSTLKRAHAIRKRAQRLEHEKRDLLWSLFLLGIRDFRDPEIRAARREWA